MQPHVMIWTWHNCGIRVGLARIPRETDLGLDLQVEVKNDFTTPEL